MKLLTNTIVGFVALIFLSGCGGGGSSSGGSSSSSGSQPQSKSSISITFPDSVSQQIPDNLDISVTVAGQGFTDTFVMADTDTIVTVEELLVGSYQASIEVELNGILIGSGSQQVNLTASG